MEQLTTALALYGLDSASTELIRDYDNLVYRVEAKQVYALRICPLNLTQARIKSEVDWSIALTHDTDLLVPKPVLNQQGKLISQLGDRFCVLFEWLEGEPVSRNMSLEVASQIGKLMAKLHQHASSYSPNNYDGDRYNYNYFFGSASWWQLKAEKRLTYSYQSLILAIKRAKRLIKSLEESSEQFGMIHSDIHFSNVIKDREKYAIIDFSDCGMGYYLMDIAVTEAEFKDYIKAKELIAAFRSSYRNHRGYFPDPEYVRTFEVMSSLLLLEWIFESDNEKVRDDKAKWLPSIINTIQATV